MSNEGRLTIAEVQPSDLRQSASTTLSNVDVPTLLSSTSSQKANHIRSSSRNGTATNGRKRKSSEISPTETQGEKIETLPSQPPSKKARRNYNLPPRVKARKIWELPKGISMKVDTSSPNFKLAVRLHHLSQKNNDCALCLVFVCFN